MYKFFSQIGTILLASICVFNIPVESGINKKNFKSKTVNQLIDLLGDDELLEKKVIKLVNKSNLNLMCKLHLYSLPMEVSWRKQTMIDTMNDKWSLYKKSLNMCCRISPLLDIFFLCSSFVRVFFKIQLTILVCFITW